MELCDGCSFSKNKVIRDFFQDGKKYIKLTRPLCSLFTCLSPWATLLTLTSLRATVLFRLATIKILFRSVFVSVYYGVCRKQTKYLFCLSVSYRSCYDNFLQMFIPHIHYIVCEIKIP